jgi:hypothetical protein
MLENIQFQLLLATFAGWVGHSALNSVDQYIGSNFLAICCFYSHQRLPHAPNKEIHRSY